MPNKLAAYLIHLLTTCGAVAGLFSLWAIDQHRWSLYFILIVVTIAIDAIDGTFARLVQVKQVLPNFDGTLLDNMIDFFNFSLIPSYFILAGPLLHHPYNIIGSILIILASAYQFSQRDAKTPDHFFKGFPSYWNILVFYLFYWQTGLIFNSSMIMVCFILSFIPMKFVYPSRVDYVSKYASLRVLMIMATLVWGVVSCLLIATYPVTHTWLDVLSIIYIVGYFIISFYRTLNPLPLKAT